MYSQDHFSIMSTMCLTFSSLSQVVRKLADRFLIELDVPFEDEDSIVVVKHFTPTIHSKVLGMPSVVILSATVMEDLVGRGGSPAQRRTGRSSFDTTIHSLAWIRILSLLVNVNVTGRWAHSAQSDS